MPNREWARTGRSSKLKVSSNIPAKPFIASSGRSNLIHWIPSTSSVETELSTTGTLESISTDSNSRTLRTTVGRDRPVLGLVTNGFR
ncbi:MAG: Uncharacterised protein [Methanobacteriota archaeon]|nr:MAG: Uncharacterised protein [Euryarchaeota archaeon]